MLCGSGLDGLNLTFAIPLDEIVQVVTIRPVSSKGPFVEQAPNATTKADLIGMILAADRPRHFAMPATPKDYNCRAGNACRKQTQGPQPTTFFLFFHQRHRPAAVVRISPTQRTGNDNCKMFINNDLPTFRSGRAGEVRWRVLDSSCGLDKPDCFWGRSEVGASPEP